MQIADLVLASAIMFGSVLSVQAQNNWMEDLEDSRLVTSLSLPGAHDAATGEGWMGIAEITGDLAAKAQDLTVAEQWNAGVRVFDIRPQVDESLLRCMHGISGTKLLVGDFFAQPKARGIYLHRGRKILK